MPANLTAQYRAAEVKFRAARTIEDRRMALEEIYAGRFPALRFSATARTGFQALKLELWRLLGVARVYTKPPGMSVDRGSPFLLPLGSTVLELAVRIHQELPGRLAYARVWGGRLEGQKVARDFELRDRDVVELAT